MFRISLVTLVISLIGINAFASGGSGGTGIIFSPSLMYSSASTNNGSTTTSTSSLLLDARLGYEFSSELYLGAYYDSQSSVNASNVTLTHTEMGADIGYFFSSGFRIIGTYLLSLSDGTTATTNNTGTGFLVNFGYAIGMGSWAFVPELTYYSLTYDTSVTNGVSTALANKITVSGIRPTFGFQFHF